MLYRNLVLTGGNCRVGKSIIKFAIQHNFKVFFSYCKNRKAAKNIHESYNRSKNISFQKLDLNKEISIKKFFHSAKKLGKIDFFINCASIKPKKKKFLKCNIKDFKKNTAIYNGFLLALKHELNLIKNQKIPYPTKIINFSSRISFTGGKNLSHYAPMKAAINLITLILSKEHDGKKVTFNTICPGKIINNYQHKRRRNKKMRKYITSEILSQKIFSIYFNKNKKINGKLFLLDKH